MLPLPASFSPDIYSHFTQGVQILGQIDLEEENVRPWNLVTRINIAERQQGAVSILIKPPFKSLRRINFRGHPRTPHRKIIYAGPGYTRKFLQQKLFSSWKRVHNVFPLLIWIRNNFSRPLTIRPSLWRFLFKVARSEWPDFVLITQD